MLIDMVLKDWHQRTLAPTNVRVVRVLLITANVSENGCRRREGRTLQGRNREQYNLNKLLEDLQ